MKTCRTCRQPVREKPVIVHRFKNGSTVVEASCQCFGTTFRLHSSESCPLLRRLRAEGL